MFQDITKTIGCTPIVKVPAAQTRRFQDKVPFFINPPAHLPTPHPCIHSAITSIFCASNLREPIVRTATIKRRLGLEDTCKAPARGDPNLSSEGVTRGTGQQRSEKLQH